MDDIAIVILAAGASRRFGSAKQLANLEGRPLVVHSVETALATKIDAAFIVLGANFADISAVVSSYPIGILRNRHWREGMSASIRLAVQSLESRYGALLFLAADQVAVKARHLDQLAGHWRLHTDSIVAARYADTLGIPAIFPAVFFPELASLQGDKGAKEIILQHGRSVVAVPMPVAARDIDCLADM